MKNWLLGKETDAGKDWKWEEKGTTEDEMVGWHHQLYGHEFEQVPGVGDGQRSLVCLVWWDSMGSQRVGHDWVTELNWIAGLSPVMCRNQYHFSHTHYVLDWVSQDVYAMVIKLESTSKSPRELVTAQIPGLHLQIFWVSRPGVGSDSVHFKPVPRWCSSRR